MEALDEAEAGFLIETGLASFETWRAPRPLAFRAGNLQIGRPAYRALKANGIAISSSLGLAIHRTRDASLWIENGRQRIEGVLEVPILTYSDLKFGRRRHLKNLTNITTLDLRKTNITDAGLEHLAGLTNLKMLQLEDTNISSKGIEKLQSAIAGCKITQGKVSTAQ